MKTSKYSNLKTLAGSAGLTAASIGAANAATVQITLTGNTVNTAGNSLNLDLTGDGNDDLTFATQTASGYATVGYVVGSSSVRAAFAGVGGAAAFASDGVFYASIYDNVGDTSPDSPTALSISRLIPFTFTDSQINGGAVTNAFLDTTATNISATSHEVTLNRIIFDDANTAAPTGPFAATETEFSAVPEPSSLVLLALGAGGLAARRRRHAA